MKRPNVEDRLATLQKSMKAGFGGGWSDEVVKELCEYILYLEAVMEYMNTRRQQWEHERSKLKRRLKRANAK